MKNNVTKERITEEIVTYNSKRTYKPDQPKSNSLMNYGKMKAIKLYIQHENECYELLSTNTSNKFNKNMKRYRDRNLVFTKRRTIATNQRKKTMMRLIFATSMIVMS